MKCWGAWGATCVTDAKDKSQWIAFEEREAQKRSSRDGQASPAGLAETTVLPPFPHVVPGALNY